MGSSSTFPLSFGDHVHIYERVPFARVFVCSDGQDGLQIYIRTWTPAYEQDRCAFGGSRLRPYIRLLMCLPSARAIMEVCALAPHRPSGFITKPPDISGSASAGPTGSPCLPLLAQSWMERRYFDALQDSYASLKLSLLISIAHAIRAVLFARAIAATLTWRRCITALIQQLCRSSRRPTKRITARAPCTSRVRR